MCTSVFHHDCTPAEEPASDSVTRAIESNLSEYWLTLGTNPDGNVHLSNEISWGYSGSPFFNRVVNARLTPENVDRYINGIVRTFRKRQAAVTWLVSPSTSPADIGDRLQHFGFNRQEVWAGMVHDLSGPEESPIDLPDVRVQAVDSERSRKDWCDVVTRSFEFPHGVRDLLTETFAERSETDSAKWIHNLAYLDQTPVAASTLFITDGIAGIYLVSTVPEARGMGLGTAMTWRALTQAREMGCRLAVLQSTDDAQTLYVKLGFRHHCNIEVYRLPAPVPLWKRIAIKSVRMVQRKMRVLPWCSRLTNRGGTPDTQISQSGRCSTAQTRS